MNQPILSGITVYPVKGCRGIALPQAALIQSGLLWDREWMIVDRAGTFVSQRTMPTLARIGTAFEVNALVLRFPGHEDCCLPIAWLGGVERTVMVHRDRLQATDCGDRAAEWVSRALGGEYRVVRMGPQSKRPVASRVVAQAETAFADAFPLLVISEASLADLNTRIAVRGGTPVPMDRFRPNLVASGCAPYAEDTWREFRIGNMTFVGEKPCTRCSVTTVDQATAERSVEPLATLATYRKTPDGVIFGMNVTPRPLFGTCTLEVGMAIEVIEVS